MRSGCRECQRTLPAISSRMLRFPGSLVWAGTRSGVVGSMAEGLQDGTHKPTKRVRSPRCDIPSKRLVGGIGLFRVWLAMRSPHKCALHDTDNRDEEPHVAPDEILRLGMGFWASKTLLSAVELGVFTTLAQSPADLATLRTKLGLHERSARDFLDALVALKVLQRQAGVYRNTPEADLFLDKSKPSYVGGLLEMANSRLYLLGVSHRGSENR